MMAGIRGKDTAPELVIRRALHRRGFRYRLNIRGLPGRPDIVLARFRVAIFVHGCFWHRHPDCRLTAMPSTRKDFWTEKFASNVARDQAALAALKQAGWRTAVVWECATRRLTPELEDQLADWIRAGGEHIELGAEAGRD